MNEAREGGVALPETAQSRHEAFTRQYYANTKRLDRAAVRSAHGDAAHMCDAIAADIIREHTRRGRLTNHGKALAAALKRAGDAIWAMRELVDRTPPRQEPQRDA